MALTTGTEPRGGPAAAWEGEESRAWLDFVLESTGACLWEWWPGREREAFSWSAAAVAVLGGEGPRDERDLVERFQAEDRDGLRACLEALRVGEAGALLASEARLLDGTRCLRLQARASGAGGAERRVSGLFIDVSATRPEAARLTRLAEAARVIAWEMDLASGYTRCSPNAARIWGFHEGPGSAYFERVHPEDRVMARPQNETGVGDEREYAREYRVVAVTGEERWLHSRGDVVCDAQGRPVKLLGVSLDVTDLKRAERAAVELGERLERAQQAARLGTWEWDTLTGAATWSDGIYDLLGVPRRAFAPDTEKWKQFILLEDLESVMTRVGEALERGGEFNFEYRVRRADGELRWVGAIGRVDRGPHGRGARMLGINIDVTERREIAEELRRSERQFRSMFESAAVGMAQADTRSGRLVAVNAALCELSGYTREELLGMTYIELTHPDDRSVSLAERQSLLLGERDHASYEKRYLRKDGGVRWVLVSVGLVRDEEGRPWRATAIVTDLTELKRSEQALREAQERERACLEHLPVGVWFLNAEGRITYGNRAGQEIWGGARYVGPEEFGVYKGWWHGTGRRLAPEDWGAARAVRRGESSLNEVIDIEAFDGVRKTMLNSAVPVRDAAGAVQGAVIFTQDVTAWKEAERRLRESESTLRSFYESSPLLMGLVDLAADDSEIVHVYDNGATERLLGLPRGGTVGRGAREFGTTEEVLARWIRHYRLSESTGQPAQFDYCDVRGGGGAIWLSCVVAHIGPSGNGRSRFSYVAQDVTARKQMELELIEAQAALRRHAARLERTVEERTAELRAANEQMETFVYSVAHDLRGPLRAVTGFSQLLIEDHGARLDESGRHMLARMQGAAEFMDRLVLDLLAFGRTAQAEMELGPVPVARAWEAAWFQCAAEAERTGARVEVVGAPLPQVRGHESTLGQMLANLLGNALKFTKPGERPELRFRAEEKGDRVRLWVEDRGIGIAPEQHERVFRVFERLHGARYSGTGVGLAIVRKGAERMGGTVGVESRVGEGSRFWIELPRV